MIWTLNDHIDNSSPPWKSKLAKTQQFGLFTYFTQYFHKFHANLILVFPARYVVAKHE